MSFGNILNYVPCNMPLKYICLFKESYHMLPTKMHRKHVYLP